MKHIAIPLIAFAVALVVGCSQQIPDLPTELPRPAKLETLSGTETVPENPGSADTARGESAWPKTLEIKRLHKANYNPHERDYGRSFRALVSSATYEAELTRHTIETPRQVDFNTSQVLVSSAGEKPTGGYSVSVMSLEEYEDRVVATVVLTNPGASCITTQALSFPFEFITVPSRKPIEILERKKTSDC